MQKAVELDKNDAQAQLLLCNFYLAVKNREAALAQYAKIKAENPALARTLYAEIFKGKIIVAAEK